jgi:hypothetical protein
MRRGKKKRICRRRGRRRDRGEEEVGGRGEHGE